VIIPWRNTGWSFLVAIFPRGAAVAMGSAKMLEDTMMGFGEVTTADMTDVGDSSEVGRLIELVMIGWRVSRPLVSRLVWSESVVSGSWLLRLGRICTVPDGPTLVITFTVEVLTGRMTRVSRSGRPCFSWSS
jgi:hypothetical protein